MMAFSKALFFGFVEWDDDLNIYRNPHITGIGSADLQWMFTDISHVRRYLPLTWLGWALNYQLFGFQAWSYHLGNILLHSANAVLVYLSIRRLLSVEAKFAGVHQLTGCSLSAAFAALVWAIHPLRVEPVTWASGRIYCQTLFFLLISLLAYLRSTVADGPRAKMGLYWLSAGAYVASLMTYPLALAFPFVLVLVDLYKPAGMRTATGGNDYTLWRIVLPKAPFFVAAGLALIITLWASTHAAGVWKPPVTLREFGTIPRIMQAFYLWAYYLWRPFFPVALSPVYDTLVDFRPGAWPFVLSALSVVGISLLLIWKRQRWRGLLILWLCYLAFLVPMIGLTEHPHYPSDRYSYLVGVVWSVAFGFIGIKVLMRPAWRVTAIAAGLAMLLVLGAASFAQAGVWQNSEILFRHMLAHLQEGPTRAAIHWRLGRTLAREEKFEEALKEFSNALRLRPEFAEVHQDMAATSSALGRASEAVSHYREALRWNPASAGTLNNLAWILATDSDAALRNGAEAVRLAYRACEITHFENALMVGTLAAAYAEVGRFAEALEAAKKAQGLAISAGNSALAARNGELLEFYRAHRPYHQPSTGGN